uniref:Uncharacterized protein n=1 Tax=Tanacetum cinerariifolium TaxID=118510 RepID=A0A699GZ76_TANCI|nr:hypothetical protein [Tanacetum cinerariifolium]
MIPAVETDSGGDNIEILNSLYLNATNFDSMSRSLIKGDFGAVASIFYRRWPEIKRYLTKNPGMRSEDMPDRVFEMKVRAFIRNLKNEKPFGQVAIDLYMIEFDCVSHLHIEFIHQNRLIKLYLQKSQIKSARITSSASVEEHNSLLSEEDSDSLPSEKDSDNMVSRTSFLSETDGSDADPFSGETENPNDYTG